MNTVFRTSTWVSLTAGLLLSLTAPALAGGGTPDCEPVPFGPGTNEGELKAFGVGNLGSEITFVMTNPPVADAFASLFFSGASVEIPDPPRGVILVDNSDAGFTLLPAIGRFNGDNTAFLWRVQIPDDFFLAGTSLYWQGIMTDPRSDVEPRLTNGIEVCRCGQFPDLVMRRVVVPAEEVFLGQQLQVGDDVFNDGVQGSMASKVGIYLSTDKFITTGDIRLGERVLFPLSVGFGFPVYNLYQIPPDFTPGDYYVGAIADFEDVEDEVSELNNIGVAMDTITVAGPPSSLSYSNPVTTYFVGQTIQPNTATVDGIVTYYTVDPKLPAGLSLDVRSGDISGTPFTMSTLTSYTVTAHNLAGNTSAVVQIAVDTVGRQ